MYIKILQLVTRIENIIGVHRSYHYLPKFGKLLVWLRIFVEIALITCIAVVFSNRELVTHKMEIMNYVLVIGSSCSIVILSIYHSENFKNLTYSIEKSHAYFVNDSVYLNRLDRRFKYLTSITTVLFIIKIAMLIYTHIVDKELIIIIRNLVFHTFLLICNLRYTIQYILLYTILFLQSEHVKCITRRISKERKFNSIENEENEDIQSVNEDDIQHRTSFDEWTTVYTNIKKCSNLINSIFGVQITLMLITLTFFFIMYLYAFTFLSVNGKLNPAEWMIYNYKITVFLLLLFAISLSAQSVQNSSQVLQRRLGKLLINSLSEIDTFKATKDFLRLVSNRPINTQGFGSINVDMTLVPKFVMFFTSYTVIALQFNNVV